MAAVESATVVPRDRWLFATDSGLAANGLLFEAPAASLKFSYTRAVGSADFSPALCAAVPSPGATAEAWVGASPAADALATAVPSFAAVSRADLGSADVGVPVPPKWAGAGRSRTGAWGVPGAAAARIPAPWPAEGVGDWESEEDAGWGFLATAFAWLATPPGRGVQNDDNELAADAFTPEPADAVVPARAEATLFAPTRVRREAACAASATAGEPWAGDPESVPDKTAWKSGRWPPVPASPSAGLGDGAPPALGAGLPEGAGAKFGKETAMEIGLSAGWVRSRGLARSGGLHQAELFGEDRRAVRVVRPGGRLRHVLENGPDHVRLHQ